MVKVCQNGTSALPCLLYIQSFMKKDKKKAFKIHAKIEDVGLNEV